MKYHLRMVRLVAGTPTALACLLSAAISLQAQTTNWTFESGTLEGWTLRSRYPATPATDDPLRAGDEAVTGIGGPNGLPGAGAAWSLGTMSQWEGFVKALENDGTYNPADTNLMGVSGFQNTRGQSNFLNTYALNQHGDSLHSATNDQIAKSPVVTLPANAVLLVWNYGGGNSSVSPALDTPGEEYTVNSGGIAVRSAAGDSLVASTRTLAQGTLRATSLDLSAFAGQNVYFELVDAYAGGFGWVAVDEVAVTQNTLNLPPNAFTFEAEDFNFDGGQYIDNPNLTLGDPNCYYQKGSGLGVAGVDFREANPSVRFGFGGVEWRYDGINSGFAGVPQTTNSVDVVRSQYTTAGVADFDLANNAAEEWWNYTRTFPNTNGHLYARVAASGPFAIRVDEVSNATVSNQTLITRGWFIGTGEATGLYQMVPLTDITGTNQLVLAFDGTPRTLRMTALTSGFIANFFALDPTNLVQNLIPVVGITSPTNNQVLTLGAEITIAATASDDGSVTNVQFYVTQSGVETLVGEDNTAPYSVNWTPTGTVEGTVKVRVVAIDNAGLSSDTSVTAKTLDPTFIRVPTTVGNGADNMIREQTPAGNFGGNAEIEVRMNSANHNAVVFRFDVSGYDLSQVSEATLNMYAGRDYGSGYEVLVLGVLPTATNSAAPSFTPFTYLESELTYSNMPGLLPPDPVSTTNLSTYEWDTNGLVLVGTNIFNGLNAQPLMALGVGIKDYLISQAGQTNIVFMIESGNKSTLLGRVMAKEANYIRESPTVAQPWTTGEVGEFAPYLRFKLAAPSLVITAHSLNGDQLTLNWSGGTGPYTVQKKTLITDVWADEQTGIAGNSATVTISLDGGGSGYYQVVGQ